IAESTLLTLAAEQQRIEQSRPPRRGYEEAPPDLPPLDYHDLDAPPEEDDVGTSHPVLVRPASQPRSARDAARWEADCLGALLRDPDLLYQINRKFRELAGTETALLAGPLCEFGVDDFSHSDYQILARIFIEALDQDELAPLDYLRANIDEVLRETLDSDVLTNDVERLQPYLRHGLSADLVMVLKRT